MKFDEDVASCDDALEDEPADDEEEWSELELVIVLEDEVEEEEVTERVELAREIEVVTTVLEDDDEAMEEEEVGTVVSSLDIGIETDVEVESVALDVVEEEVTGSIDDVEE